MDYFPIFLNLKKTAPCLVVGGGAVAARKVELLIRAGATVLIVAREVKDEIRHLARGAAVQIEQREFRDEDVVNVQLVVAATSDPELNRRIFDLAQQRNVPVNVVDQPDLCTFVVPSVVDRSPLVIAVSSGGASPILARLIRAKLESLIPSAYGRLAALAGRYRERVKATLKNAARRKRFWESVLQGGVAELVLSGKESEAEGMLERKLAATADEPPAGEVYLIGGGPGDPDLLTFRALRLLQSADVVVHDRLVSPQVVDLARREAERIYVGKERDRHTLTQEGINELLVRLAKEGKRVVRLKGGDPFIFGRGGEEIETLASEGIHFQVVPGITAASGCAAYAGIPLTHRDYSQACIFVTGHLKDGSMNLNWDALVQPNQTVVFYMGLSGLDVLCRELISHGMPKGTPAALVQQGTTQKQRVIIGTVLTLPDLVRVAQVRPPTLVIVGDVVRLHEKLRWFDPHEGVDASWEGARGAITEATASGRPGQKNI